jgi:hypothetical protein
VRASIARQVDLAWPNLPRGAVRPFQRFPFNLTHGFPWTDLIDDFGFEEVDDALGQRIIIGITNGSDLKINVGFS